MTSDVIVLLVPVGQRKAYNVLHQQAALRRAFIGEEKEKADGSSGENAYKRMVVQLRV